MAYQDLTRRGC